MKSIRTQRLVSSQFQNLVFATVLIFFLHSNSWFIVISAMLLVSSVVNTNAEHLVNTSAISWFPIINSPDSFSTGPMLMLLTHFLLKIPVEVPTICFIFVFLFLYYILYYIFHFFINLLVIHFAFYVRSAIHRGTIIHFSWILPPSQFFSVNNRCRPLGIFSSSLECVHFMYLQRSLEMSVHCIRTDSLT